MGRHLMGRGPEDHGRKEKRPDKRKAGANGRPAMSLPRRSLAGGRPIGRSLNDKKGKGKAPAFAFSFLGAETIHSRSFSFESSLANRVPPGSASNTDPADYFLFYFIYLLL